MSTYMAGPFPMRRLAERHRVRSSMHRHRGVFSCWCSVGNENWNDLKKRHPLWCPLFGNRQTVHSMSHSLPHLSHRLQVPSPDLVSFIRESRNGSSSCLIPCHISRTLSQVFSQRYTGILTIDCALGAVSLGETTCEADWRAHLLDLTSTRCSVTVAVFWGKVDGKEAATGDPGSSFFVLLTGNEIVKMRGCLVSRASQVWDIRMGPSFFLWMFKWVWLKNKQEGLRRCCPLFPLRVPFWYRFVEPRPHGLLSIDFPTSSPGPFRCLSDWAPQNGQEENRSRSHLMGVRLPPKSAKGHLPCRTPPQCITLN